MASEGATTRADIARARAQATARRVHGLEETKRSAGRYVGLVTRAIAFAIDAAVIDLLAALVGVVFALVYSILPASQDLDTIAVAVGAAAFLLWCIGYFVAFWTATGQTPGNRIMQIRVERIDGEPMLPRDALLRLVGIVLSAPLLIGFLPILVTERRRGLHDWMAKTVVVAVEPEEAPDTPAATTGAGAESSR